jgi:hypothetical protein
MTVGAGWTDEERASSANIVGSVGPTSGARIGEPSYLDRVRRGMVAPALLDIGDRRSAAVASGRRDA